MEESSWWQITEKGSRPSRNEPLLCRTGSCSPATHQWPKVLSTARRAGSTSIRFGGRSQNHWPTQMSVLTGRREAPTPLRLPKPAIWGHRHTGIRFSHFSGENITSISNFNEQGPQAKNALPPSWQLPRGTQGDVTRQKILPLKNGKHCALPQRARDRVIPKQQNDISGRSEMCSGEANLTRKEGVSVFIWKGVSGSAVRVGERRQGREESLCRVRS